MVLRRQVYHHGLSVYLFELKYYLRFSDRNYKTRFEQGVSRARGNYHKIYNHRVSGEGASSEYYCASQQTVDVIDKWQKYDGVKFTIAHAKANVKLMRKDWLTFMEDPSAYIPDMLQVNPCCSDFDFIPDWHMRDIFFHCRECQNGTLQECGCTL
jgi:hypothetical protein